MTGPAAARWRQQLAAWALPQSIVDSVDESPWALSTALFARRTRDSIAAPAGPSYARAAQALRPPGSVLDVGAGTGAASLPLADRMTSLTAVDERADMLEELAAAARPLGVAVTGVTGRWPQIAPAVALADVVVCHHVGYNAPDLADFAVALHGHAGRRVVMELTDAHPMMVLNPLWARLHGLERPTGPTAADAVAVLREAGIEPTEERWRRPATPHPSFEALVEVTRRRICLPPARRDELIAALRDLGVDPARPTDLGAADRELVTLWWDTTG